MPELDYAAMGKEALRAEMRERELSYSRMNNDQMRAALRANDAEMADVLDAENDFEMTKEERAAQTPRQNLITVETADGPTEVDLNKLAIDPSNNPGGIKTPPAPRTRKGVTIEKDREERNGVKRPSKGGVCREVWDYLDTFQEMGPRAPSAKDVREEAPRHNWNSNNALLEFYQWRKFNGISGRAK
jgi:hypothetical protein